VSVPARAVGINHVALTVGDIDAALDFYGGLVAFELRSRGPRSAFIDLGDQFLALSAGEAAGDPQRHFGLVVDDKEAVRAAVLAAGIDVPPSGHLRFRDPWGNAIEIVDYRDVQFGKTPGVLAGMGLEGLEKTPQALEELAKKGLAG
jgi:lactoylglutathione lyase